MCWYEKELHAHFDGSEETVARIDVQPHHHLGSMHEYFGLFHLDYGELWSIGGRTGQADTYEEPREVLLNLTLADKAGDHERGQGGNIVIHHGMIHYEQT